MDCISPGFARTGNDPQGALYDMKAPEYRRAAASVVRDSRQLNYRPLFSGISPCR